MTVFRRLRQSARRRVELAVFGVTIALLLSLGGWWYLHARRVTADYFELARKLVVLTAPTEQAATNAQLKAIDDKFQRRLFMLSGEGAMFFGLLGVSIVILFIVARQKRLAMERMERVLQLTTHELKTPIAGVKALLQSLELGSIPAADRARYLAQGLTECERLEHLAESILAYQRAISRLDGSHVASTTAQALVSAVLGHRERSMLSDGVEVQIADGDTPLRADRDACRVILENLLDNARKYGDPKQRAKLTGARVGSEYRLALRDFGIGYPPEIAEQLFEPFVRQEQVAAKMHGTGLGLFIARQLAERQGGRLLSESPGPHMGSTFTLVLQVAEHEVPR